MADWLSGALDTFGVRAIAAEPVAGPAPVLRHPKTFVVTTASGAKFKIRRALRSRSAAVAEALLQAIGDPRLPVPLKRAGRLTLERWVDGSDLRVVPLTTERLGAAAQLLAAVHRCPGLDGDRLPRSQSTAPVLRRAAAQLDELAAVGMVGAEEARRLHLIVARLPITSRWGLAHGDLCGENLVERLEGGVVSVDNEQVHRTYLDADLARAFYRWPMDAAQRQRFERVYRAAAGVEEPPRQQSAAWRAAAAIKGAHLRYRWRADPSRALAVLRTLAEPDRSDEPDPAGH